MLAACGNDSTASDTPTLSSAASAPEAPAATASAAAPAPGAPASSSDALSPESGAPAESSSAAAGSPAAVPPPAGEQAQPAQSAAPSGDSAAASPKEAAYLDALRKQGLTLSGNGENALSIGAYVCQGVQQGATDEELATFVNAMAGSEESVTGGKHSAEEAGKIYLDTAKSTYCT